MAAQVAKGGAIPVNPYDHTVENLVRRERTGQMPDWEKARHIRDAEYYARRNKLSFDGTFAGAMRLAAHADRIIREHRELMDKMRAAAQKPRKVIVEGHEKGREFRGERLIDSNGRFVN